MRIIDAQMNYGKNLFGPDSDIELYLNNIFKSNVEKVILLPTGTHELKLNNGDIEKSCIWSYELETLLFKRIIEKNGRTIEEINPLNPYENMNMHSIELVKDLNSIQDIKFYFSPKIHPKLDTEETIEKFLYQPETVATKIQTLSSYTYPENMPKWLIDLIKGSNKPLMVHTDYRKGNPKDILSKLANRNNSKKWAEWALKNEIKVYLAHGLRLEKKAAEIVNENDDLFMVGIGPDTMLNEEKNSLFIKGDYLTLLFDMVNEDNLAFNYDFAWNVLNRGVWDDLDWESPKRIKNIVELHNLGNNFLQKIFYDNANKFFKLR